MRPRTLHIVTAVAAVGLTLAACGGDGGSEAAKPAPRLVPKLAGQPTATAQRALSRDGLQPKVDQRWDERAPVGSVIATRPAAGAQLARGRSVAVTVSKGPPPGPHGTLTATAVGAVPIGASTATVEEQFGLPETRRPPSEADREEWTWTRPSFRLIVDPDRKVVTGYCTPSPTFRTDPFDLRAGRVTGSAVAKISARAGKPAVLAPDVRPRGARRNLMLSASKPGSYPALVFNADDNGTVTEICGGRPPGAG